MDEIVTILILLAAVVASDSIARAASARLPLPFVQIALGGLIASTVNLHISIAPELFLLLFIAPLLFLDGWRIPREGLLEDKWTICALALGLVLFTVVGAGYFIHWMIPAMPLAVAIALAGLLSPTDAVALSAIAQHAPFPKRLMHILQGEALLNDASGLVCFRFAVAAMVTGAFSIVAASGTFLWLVVGGLAIGAGVAVIANAGKDLTSRHFGEETGSQILISLLIPFAAYLLAAQLQTSGILAAVAAGVAMNHEERSGRALPVTRIRRAAVWDAIQFAGNGVIFVLLGYQLRAIVRGAEHVVQQTGALGLTAYVLAIAGMLLFLRALWVWVTLRFFPFGPSRRDGNDAAPGWRVVAVTSVAGVRGALTLSGVMSLPLTLSDGTPFPARDLAIILAAGVIIASLAIANATLPSLLKGLPTPAAMPHRRQEEAARVAAWQAAIAAVEAHVRFRPGMQTDAVLYAEASAHIVDQYRQRIAARSDGEARQALSRRAEDIEHRLRILALRAERDTYYRIAQSGGLTDEVTRNMVRELDFQEARLAERAGSTVDL